VTRQLKGVIPTDFPSLGLPWLLSAAAGLYGRTHWPIASRRSRISSYANVPGPDAPLYLAGARLKTYWPVSIVEHGLGLNITLQSYAGSLDFGILAARVGMPDAGPWHAACMRHSPNSPRPRTRLLLRTNTLPIAAGRPRRLAPCVPRGAPRRTRNKTFRTPLLSDA